MSNYVIKFKAELQKGCLKPLGGYESLPVKTLASAIQKAGFLSKQTSKGRYEVYFKGDKKLKPSLIMVIQNGVTIESKG